MEPFAPHPGTIRSLIEYDGSVSIKQADQVPERHRFVYVNAADQEVASRDEAVKRIPIVEVRMMALDADGKLVPKERAKTMYIREYGPGQQMLRSVTMTKK